MGSHADAHRERSEVVGQWVAGQGYHLLTGAGEGVMSAVSQAFAEVADRAGRVIGIVPSVQEDPARPSVPGYPNPWVEIPIFTHLGVGVPTGDNLRSRNHINILTASAIILLPGGDGTASEGRLALRYGKPCVGFLQTSDEIPSLPNAIPVEHDFANVIEFISGALASSAPSL
jgi:uncharacterized protein (TIGR00725 family)